ncbi:MAG: SMP-30/gluconolactonase/LRE family protein, partial [Verrucomicrobiales bacterium]
IEAVGARVSQWGEGPIWWEDKLYYVDIEGHAVIEFDPTQGQERRWNVGERVGFVVPRESGGLVIGGDSGLHFLDIETGDLEHLTDPESDKADNRFNDGKCAPDGRLFAGTISLVKKTGDARLYRLDPDQSLTEVFGPVTNSNGIGWSPDGKICHYIDTPRKEVLSFDYDSGQLSNLRTSIDTSAIEASPDGLAVDSDGNVWIAFCHGACVACYSPESGEMIRKVDLPCLETTACAFGGPGLTDLYVTTGVHKTEVEELAGRLLIVQGLGVTGLPSHPFAG